MRRRLLFLGAAVLLVAPATAHAQGGGGALPSTGGGAEYGQPSDARRARPRLASFSVAPPQLQPGGPGVRFSFRVNGRARRVRTRIELIAAGARRPARRLSLGRRRTGRAQRFTWAPKAGEIAPGNYVARLTAVDPRGRKLVRSASASGRLALQVVEPVAPSPVAGGVFPIQGEWSFGGEDARFGAGRPGHAHQGQDVIAAEGTPLVAVRPGYVRFRDFQAGGAGNYLVLRGDDRRDYVYMHLQDGSLLVDKGAVVTGGQRIASVGNTGRSSGPHLHFELWPNGWQGDGSAPIDPLPELRAWAGAAG